MRLIFSIVLLTVVMVGLYASGTLAQFTDLESDSATITAGILDNLKIKETGDPTFGDSATSDWNLSNVEPGKDTFGLDKVFGSITLCRDTTSGTITPNHLEIQAFPVIDEAANPLESDTDPATTSAQMAAKLEITAMTYFPNGSTINLLDGIGIDLADADGDGKKTLNDLSFDPDGATPNGLDDLPIPPVCGVDVGVFEMTMKWIEGADDNDFQGDGLDTEIKFTLNQLASQ